MYQITTQNGYKLGEVISALQKDIRRGNEYNAMYWCLELIPKFENYLWKRLTVIVNEDIGIAAPELLTLVPSQANVYFAFREDKGRSGSARLVLANTILAMCRAPKSRIADHFQCTVLQNKIHMAQMPIPDYALDKHTGAGKQMGRGTEHWLEEGCKLVNPADLDDPYAVQAAEWWKSPTFKKIDWAPRTGGSAGKPTQGSLFDAIPSNGGDDDEVTE